MCGIAGFCDFGNKSNKDILIKMTDTLNHRGPDGGGYYYQNILHSDMGLGHRRLSIIDLTLNANQPLFVNEFCIVFNGEIYNYLELKKELLLLGHQFKTNSDTEVVLISYLEWGISCVNKFIGMFAFCIYDHIKKQLVFARDRAGVKPFYYYFNNDLFLFGSELKALMAHPAFEKKIDEDGLSQFFKFGYIPAPQTIFSNTHKLLPGHYLVLDINSKLIETVKYWDVFDYYSKPKIKIDEADAVDHIENLLISSFQYRMISDVPVGVFLSGGYDSTAVAAILQKNNSQRLKTFTIGFEDSKYNEAVFAKETALYLGTDHHELYCSAQDGKEIIPLLPEIYDEPFGDTSSIPTYLVSKFASKYIKVALSADAGDETFAGYNKYFSNTSIYELFNNIPRGLKMFGHPLNYILFKSPIKNIFSNTEHKFQWINQTLNKKLSHLQKLDPGYFYDYEIQYLLTKKNKHNDIIEEYYNQLPNHNSDWINTLLAIDYKTYMVDDILTKVDRAGMANSIEGREPLLDHRIIEFTAQLKGDLKYKNNIQKYLLKQVVHKYIPEKMLNRPKQGFGVPIIDWLRNDLKEILIHYTDDAKIRADGILSPEYVKEIKERYLNGHNDSFNRIWLILVFQMWKEKWL